MSAVGFTTTHSSVAPSSGISETGAFDTFDRMSKKIDQLTTGKFTESNPSWSPDGRSIAFVSERGADPDRKNDSNIFVVEARVTAQPRQLTKFEGPDGGRPVWSADGKTIAYSHQRTPIADDWTSADISLVEVATATVRPLVATRAAESGATYSPDGQWIAFTASDDPPTWGFTSRVHVVAATGGTPRALAESYDRQPDIVGWSPDGKRILISETHRTINRLGALPVDGGPQVDLSAAGLMVIFGMTTAAGVTPSSFARSRSLR